MHVLTARRFIVITSDRTTAHKVLKTPSHAILAVPSVIKDTYPDTIALLQGKPHAELNKTLSSHFSPSALSSYLPVQVVVINDYLTRFVHIAARGERTPVAFLAIFRELNCAISCRTFAGNYMTEEGIQKVAVDFSHFTAAVGLFDIPLSKYIPFTTAWLGRRAAFATQETFTRCARQSRARMSVGAQPTCMIDQWVQQMLICDRYRQQLATGEGKIKKPRNMIRNYTDEEVGRVMFGHLFGSLEATSSATTWLFQILAHRPDILDRIRDENLTARGGDKNKLFDMAMHQSLPYTNAVIKEVLRYRPPVPMIPYETVQPLPVSPHYTIPAGVMVLPSFYSALHDPAAYPNPDSFDPDRWITGDAASKKKNWLVFGAGPHKCLAQRLVTLTLAHLIGKASMEVDWVHHATERSDEIRVVASMVPAVSSAVCGHLRALTE